MNSPMGHSPRPHIIDDPRVLARILSTHLGVDADEIPDQLPKTAEDLLLLDLDLDAPVDACDIGVHEKT